MADNAGRFTKGDPRIRPGRPKGALGKFSLEQARQIAAEGFTPLEFLMAVIRKDEQALSEMNCDEQTIGALDMEVRTRCAVAAAPYLHRKMPVGIDNGHGGPVGLATYSAAELAKLPEEELEHLLAVVKKLEAESFDFDTDQASGT